MIHKDLYVEWEEYVKLSPQQQLELIAGNVRTRGEQGEVFAGDVSKALYTICKKLSGEDINPSIAIPENTHKTTELMTEKSDAYAEEKLKKSSQYRQELIDILTDIAKHQKTKRDWHFKRLIDRAISLANSLEYIPAEKAESGETMITVTQAVAYAALALDDQQVMSMAGNIAPKLLKALTPMFVIPTDSRQGNIAPKLLKALTCQLMRDKMKIVTPEDAVERAKEL